MPPAAGLKFEEIDFGESHEAVTAPWFCVGRVLKEDIRIIVALGKVNFNVSGIALGQPVDNPGLRFYQFYTRSSAWDRHERWATLCAGSGPILSLPGRVTSRLEVNEKGDSCFTLGMKARALRPFLQGSAVRQIPPRGGLVDDTS